MLRRRVASSLPTNTLRVISNISGGNLHQHAQWAATNGEAVLRKRQLFLFAQRISHSTPAISLTQVMACNLFIPYFPLLLLYSSLCYKFANSLTVMHTHSESCGILLQERMLLHSFKWKRSQRLQRNSKVYILTLLQLFRQPTAQRHSYKCSS